jgi:type I restriction enzyme R subunit
LYGGNIAAFIRSVIGIDRQTAIEQFIELIQVHSLTAMQEEYLRKILDYVSINGDISTETFADEPFCNMEWIDTFGEHTTNVVQYIRQLHSIITA